ncbi:MAG: galactose-1-phosphate uridylyltransferase, partial [Planctomycetota bacterium]|nr:galactose-1-phosphate uridylyltransferase [Planctomycetota bacterium]
MPEYRQNPVTGQWVILSADRAKRPNEFKSDVPRPAVADYDKGCPFCPGHERRTPPEVFAVRDDYATVD